MDTTSSTLFAYPPYLMEPNRYHLEYAASNSMSPPSSDFGYLNAPDRRRSNDIWCSRCFLFTSVILIVILLVVSNVTVYFFMVNACQCPTNNLTQTARSHKETVKEDPKTPKLGHVVRVNHVGAAQPHRFGSSQVEFGLDEPPDAVIDATGAPRQPNPRPPIRQVEPGVFQISAELHPVSDGTSNDSDKFDLRNWLNSRTSFANKK